MFGTLVPELNLVSIDCKKLYHSSYCNLCATLSASGAGLLNRFFLVNDVVTLDWLLTEERSSAQHPFACNNCLKGGAIGKKSFVTPYQKLLAAISTFICGVKIKDNALDNPKLKNKSLVVIYRPLMKKAEALLKEVNLLEKLESYLALNRKHEAEDVITLEDACRPTENCYELMGAEIAKCSRTSLSIDMVGLFGKYLGRCVYLLDAIKDMEDDKKKNQYNVLNLLSSQFEAHHAKQHAVGTALEFLKPLRLEISDKLTLLPESPIYKTLQNKWNSLFTSIEHQLMKLIKPLKDNRLINLLSSFSPHTGCAHGSISSPFEPIKKIGLGVPTQCTNGCPFCKMCSTLCGGPGAFCGNCCSAGGGPGSGGGDEDQEMDNK
jgi:hypothetical protein